MSTASEVKKKEQDKLTHLKKDQLIAPLHVL